MFDLFFSAAIFIFGLIVGSFLNCVIHRIEINESFLKGRSFCPHCRHQLNFRDLIPILSFLSLKGKCRYCQKPISWQYPLVEMATGLLFFLIFNFQPAPYQICFGAGFPISQFLNTLYYLIITCFLIVIFVYDLKHYIIPDKIIYPAILVSGIWYLVSGIFLNLYTEYEVLNTLYSAIGAAAFFLFMVLVSGGKWMGLGDVKLAFFMGLFLGFPNILAALFSAFFIGAVAGLILIFLGKKNLKSEIPFGPFLVSGIFLALFFGEKIIDLYLRLFLIK